MSEACDLRWDDIDLAKRTIVVRRLKGSIDSSHYLERDELAGLKRLQREFEPRSAYVFVNERGPSVPARPPGCHSRFTFTCCGTQLALHWRIREWIRGDYSTT